MHLSFVRLYKERMTSYGCLIMAGDVQCCEALDAYHPSLLHPTRSARWALRSLPRLDAVTMCLTTPTLMARIMSSELKLSDASGSNLDVMSVVPTGNTALTSVFEAPT